MKHHLLIALQNIQIPPFPCVVGPTLGNTGLAERLFLLEERASNMDSSLKILAVAQDQNLENTRPEITA